MDKEHFELVAQYINGIMDSHARLQAAIAVGSACREANPLFDVDRFYSACGILEPVAYKERDMRFSVTFEEESVL